ncbi:hypothetical protein MLD38_035283 [Melastoma candidum]|uniref:Uncharacterized protein n=1 Tax=Melastoma candidum TaxID=119954 RepID=A0ACB9MG58_9MYRT|nr:hypothetical protein MLD38_035283 [Melastoma candidum]
MIDLEVVGRHALLFDDDAAAAFVNSNDALVEWNSLFIDRYDVRHLLSSPPPPRKLARRDLASRSGGALESEIERERFLDLPPPPCEDDGQEVEGKADGSGFHAVAFGYGNAEENNENKSSDTDAGFRPSFPVPEGLLQNLPTTDKVHQIIARTALFVREHGGQSEIVLRVKQGDNPTFGFLMPDNQLHPYFRFLIDHPELLSLDNNGKSSEVENGAEYGPASVGGALSLLGATYESGEEDDTLDGTKLESGERKPNIPVGDSVSGGLVKGEPLEAAAVNAKQILPSRSSSSSKDKATMIKKSHRPITVKSEGEIANKRKEKVPASDTGGNIKSTGVAGMKVGQRITEPPSDVKRLIDKIVEFIAKNGKEFEAVLVEQDKTCGRFPFLLPSSHYHPYYLAVLQKAEKSKLTGRKSSSEKNGLMFGGDEKKESSPPVGSDVPYEIERKGKFKMIIGRTKNDGHEQPSKESQQQIGVSVDVDAAAAILQAVRKGIKNPSVDIFPKASQESGSPGAGHEDRESASAYSNNGSSKAAEADSAETQLTREEKLKAERLRRAKMFTAMLKSGAVPAKTQLSRGSSLEAPNSEASGASAVPNIPILGREGSSVAPNLNAPVNAWESDSKALVDVQTERRSRRKYRSRAETHEEESEYEDKEDEVGDQFKGMDHNPSKKERSHHSSHYSRERHKRRKGHSSPTARESQRRHRHDSSDDEPRDSRRHRHEISSDDDDHVRSHRHKHHGTTDDDHSKSHRRRKRDDSSDDDNGRDYNHRHRKHHDQGRKHKESDERKRKSHLSSKDLEGEFAPKSDKKAKDGTSIDGATSTDVTVSSLGQNPSEDNDFRAKIRAMLMSTM